jgi:uncharacterized beta-barrel protein YwiB (DUF1934 family)
MEQVELTLTVKQTIDGQTEETRQLYSANATAKQTGWYISYYEQLEGVGKVHTVIRIGEDEMVLLRQGPLQTKQHFQDGNTCETTYNSPFGQFAMKIQTNLLQIKREAEWPVSVVINYQLWLNDQYVGRNKMKLDISWKEKLDM